MPYLSKALSLGAKLSSNPCFPQFFSNLRNPQCLQKHRLFASDVRGTFARKAIKKRSLKEVLLSPAGEDAFTFGKGLLAGSSLLGLGALCYYGLGYAKDTSAMGRMMLWSDEVRKRIRLTYMYFGGGITITAISAMATFRSPALLRFAMHRPILACGLSLAAWIGTSVLVTVMPYSEGFGPKQLAWMALSAVGGVVVAPICILGGPVLTQAAWYTAGIVGSLSTLAACAPSEKFLNMAGPLAIGLGVVFAASLGSIFLPPQTVLGASLYSMSIYGGLVLFSLFLLYDTQHIIKKAEMHPYSSPVPYDPINS